LKKRSDHFYFERRPGGKKQSGQGKIDTVQTVAHTDEGEGGGGGISFGVVVLEICKGGYYT